MSGLSGLLDIHAPVKTTQLIKPVPSWITDEYRIAKCMRRQYERTWRRVKSPENRTRLRQQINRCNHIKNKRHFYHDLDLVSENCSDGKDLWQALNGILSRSNVTVLPSLANRFGLFFIDKIKKIRDTFKHTPSKSFHPDKEPPTFSAFQVVTESEFLKFIKEAPSKTCSLDPCPTHILKKCLDILPHKIANLISKLNFYKLIPYPMDNSLSGRRGPARQTSEKDVLCLHRPGRSSTVHSPDGVSYFLPV